MEKKQARREKGITLVALVITIIVLIILAGVAITMLIDENGIVIQAQRATEKMDIEEEKEQISLAYNGVKIENEGGNVEADDLKRLLEMNGATNVNVKADELITVEFDSGRIYTIGGNGNIELIIGNAKEIANNAKTAYGATVTNYDVDGNTGVNWKIFYSDGINVYLIADDYINYDKVPLSTGNVNKPNQSDSFSKAVYFTNILGDYEGSSNISSNNLALKWLSKYHEKKYTSKYNNMKAVAYMMDTNIWNNFKEDTALNVIGGPTLEMLFASYNAKYGTKYECQATSERGYSIRKTASDDWSERITGILDSNDSLYTISSQSDALSYWVASPSNYYETYSEGNHLLSVYYSGSVTYSFYNAKDIGFRPVICLNPNAKLVKQADGTYQIQ